MLLSRPLIQHNSPKTIKLREKIGHGNTDNIKVQLLEIKTTMCEIQNTLDGKDSIPHAAENICELR